MYNCHNIEEIEGIGKSRSKDMKNMGLKRTEDLLRHSDLYLRWLLKKIPNFPIETLNEYISSAEFLQVEGIDGQFAEALYDNNRPTLKKLASPDPTVVVREIEQSVKDGIISDGVDISQVTKWQKRALKIIYSGVFFGKIQSKTKPISGAILYHNNETTVSDEDGFFWFPGIPYGDVKIIIRANGYKRKVQPAKVSSGKMGFNKITLEPMVDNVKTIDESKGGIISKLDSDDYLVFENVSLDELDDNTLLQIRYLYKNGNVRLSSLNRLKVGNQIQIRRTIIDGTLVENNPKVGDIYVIKSGKLEKVDETSASVSLRKRFGKDYKKITLTGIRKIVGRK